MRHILCLLGLHKFRAWVAHTEGPCVFELDIHVFRQCERCPKSEHKFATINNGGQRNG